MNEGMEERMKECRDGWMNEGMEERMKEWRDE